VKLTKTGSTRSVDLTVRLTEALSEWQARCEADALVADRDALPWIFPSESSTPLDEANVSKRFRAVLQRTKLPPVPSVRPAPHLCHRSSGGQGTNHLGSRTTRA
jgi:hypothetical protein